MNTWVEEPGEAKTLTTPPPRPSDRNLGMTPADPDNMQKAGIGRIVVVLNAGVEGICAGIEEGQLGLKENEKVVYLDWEDPVANWGQFRALAEAYIDVLASVKSDLGGLFWSPGYLYQDVVLEPLNDPDPKIRFGNHVLALALATVSCAYSGKAPPGWAQFLECAIDEALDMGWMMPGTEQTHDFIKNVGRPCKELRRMTGKEQWWRDVLLEKEMRLFLRVHEQRCTCMSCLDVGMKDLLQGGCMAENFVFDTTSEGGAFADAVASRTDLDELDRHAVASKLFLLYVCEPFRKYLMEEAQKTLDNQEKAAQLEKWRAKGQAAFGGIGTFFGGLFPAILDKISRADTWEDVLLSPILGAIHSARSTYESRRRLYSLIDAEYQETMEEIQRGRELVDGEIEMPKSATLSLPAPAGEKEAADRAAERKMQEFMGQARRSLGTLAKLAGKLLAVEEFGALRYDELPLHKLKEWALAFRYHYNDQLDVRRKMGFWEEHLASLPLLEVSPTYPRFTPFVSTPFHLSNDLAEVRMGVDEMGCVIHARVSDKRLAMALRRHYWDRNLWGMPSKHFKTIQKARKCLGPVGLDCKGARPCVYGFRRWHNTVHPNVAMVIGTETLQDTLGYDVIRASIGVHRNSLQLTRIGVMAGVNYRWLAVSVEGTVEPMRTMSSGMPASTERNLFRCIL